MSVLTELLENYEFLPNEFKRHLLLIRELEERQKGLLQDKAELQKQLKLKEVYTDEEQRNTLQNQLSKLYYEIDALSDEKLFLSEKLFSIQENFIKKLDQQIDKTEEDKTLIERCNQDAQMEDSDLPLAGKQGKHAKQKGQARGAGGQFISGKSTDLPSSYGGMDQGFMGGRQAAKRQKDQMSTNININFGGPQRKKDLQKKQLLTKDTDIIPQSVMGGRNRHAIPFSQEESLGENNQEMAEDEGSCAVCGVNKPGEVWIQCDQCNNWYHCSCVHLTPETMPGENEQYYCPNCKDGSDKRMNSLNDFGNNILY